MSSGKRLFALSLTTLAAAVASATAHAGTVTSDGQDLVIKTKGGLEVGTVDKTFTFKVGGRLQLDYDVYEDVFHKSGVGADADNIAYTGSADSLYFRRSFLEFSGTVNTDWKYVMNLAIDTDKSTAIWDEAHIDYVGFAPVTIKLGKYEADFGLEHATSSKWITAIERSMVLDVGGWQTAKQYGGQVSATGGMLYGSLGLFQNDDSLAHDGKHSYAYVARAVIAPINEAGRVLHFGLDYAHRNNRETSQSVKTSMAVKKADAITLGTNETAKEDDVFMIEAAYAMGPLSAQAEYINRNLDGGNDGDLESAEGYNVQVAYTLTGEARGYKLDGGKFDAVKPAGARGAYEVFYRFDNASGEVKAATGNPEATVHTVGMNWYANENVKVALNYLMSATDNVVSDTAKAAGSKDDGNAISARLQYAF